MSDTQTNSIAFQMKWMRDCLDNVAKPTGGVAVIAKDYLDMWEIASNSPGMKCVIVCEGEDIRGSLEIAAVAGRVDRKYAVLVSRGQGFTAHRADSLTEPVQSTESFLDLLEQIRDTIRVLLFDPGVTEATAIDPVDYKGMEAMSIDGYPVDAYLIRFSIGTQLGLVKDNSAPVLTGPPNPPSDLNVTDNGSTITLFWTINSPNVTSTIVQRSDDGGATYSNIDTVGQGVVTYTDITVGIGNLYFYQVINTSTTGNSNPSNIVSVLV